MRILCFLLPPLLGSCSLVFSTDDAASVQDAALVDAAPLDAASVDAAAPVEIILDNDGANTASVGEWPLATGASQHYNVNSRYAVVGGTTDYYRFIPNLPRASEYEVFAWNSCFSPRHVAVPHTIKHSTGMATVTVNQDCNSGTAGEWFSLGTYSFEAGADGYLEISDQGLVAAAEEIYIGADAARFVSVDSP